MFGINLHWVSNSLFFSKWQRLRGTVFRHICVRSVWISPFEGSNVNAMWWRGGCRQRCRVFFFLPHTFFCVLTSHRGRVGGLRGSFSIKDLIRFRPPSRPPCQLRADFKGVGGSSTALYLWASILSCAGFSFTQNTNTHSDLLHVF